MRGEEGTDIKNRVVHTGATAGVPRSIIKEGTI